jgi:copper chaperone
MQRHHNKQPDILIFETDIRFKKDITKVKPLIDNEGRIKKWNVDQQDCGKILRIESIDLNPDDIIKLITQAGYHCAELTD